MIHGGIWNTARGRGCAARHNTRRRLDHELEAFGVARVATPFPDSTPGGTPLEIRRPPGDRRWIPFPAHPFYIFYIAYILYISLISLISYISFISLFDIFIYFISFISLILSTSQTLLFFSGGGWHELSILGHFWNVVHHKSLVSVLIPCCRVLLVCCCT